MNNGKGFTLIESLVVIGLLVAIISVVTLKFAGNDQKLALDSALKESKSFVDLARHYSLSLNKPVSLQLTYSGLQVVGFSIVDQSSSTNVTLDSLGLRNIVASVNPFVTDILFSPTSSIQLKSNEQLLNSTANVTFIFSNASGDLGGLKLYHFSGACHIE